MSHEIEALGQILDSTFGLAFLAHLAGVSGASISFDGELVKTISDSCLKFDRVLVGGEVWTQFAEFAREYPFGEFRVWQARSRELRSSSGHLALILEKVAPTLFDLGFADDFSQDLQYSLDHSSAILDISDPSSTHRNGAGNYAWWTSPDRVFTVQQKGSMGVTWAIDDAARFPTSVNPVEIVGLGKKRVYSIGNLGDWFALAERYPRMWKPMYLDKWVETTKSIPELVLMPNWAEVARDYAGIYLKPVAFLSVSYELKFKLDRATLLSGWSPGATYWLN